jgi:hypothetical protein
MGDEFKKEAWKIGKVAIFLFITIFLVLPYLIQISTFFHERGHQITLTKYGIKNSYHLELSKTIPNFFNPKQNKLGVTKFDLSAYNQLDKYKRTEVNIAGIVSDLRFLFLIGAYLAIINIYTYYKIRFKKDYNLTWILAMNWILFMWLIALVQITVANITYSSGDVYQLIRFLRI